MPLFRLRIYWEEDDQVYRDVELISGQTFHQLHEAILKAFDFDSKHAASFYESNDRWERSREFSSEVLVNKKGAPSLSMSKTPVSALITTPNQKFVYEYDRLKKWTFLVELIGIVKEEDPLKTYPAIIRKAGIAPAQYGLRGPQQEQMVETEEAYDLEGDEEGYGNEGEGEEANEDSEAGTENYDDL